MEEELKCHRTVFKKYYKFNTSNDISWTKFALIMLYKKTATLVFRFDPEVFRIDDANIRRMKGWFFKNEARVRITPKNRDLVMECARHAFEVTHGVNSIAANKAVATREYDN